MDIEQLEIRQHMGHFAPFEYLGDEQLDRVAGAVEVGYYRAGSDILALDQEINELCYIRSGAVEVSRRGGQLFDRLVEGDVFGASDLMRNRRVRFPVRALEDSLIYFVPAELFEALRGENDDFADFVETGGVRLKATVDQHQHDNRTGTTRVRRLIRRRPVMVDADTPMREVARRMRDENVTCVLVIDNGGDHDTDNSPCHFATDDGVVHRLDGIVTDRDCCTRVLADDLDGTVPVAKVMTTQLVTARSEESVHEAMLAMLNHNIKHLPILHKRRPIGVLHLGDIMRHETRSSLYLVNTIFNQPGLAGLIRLSGDVTAAFTRLVDEGADATMVGCTMAAICKSFARRLLELGEAELGPPPVPYSFMVLGSTARDEQTVFADQDHAMVLDDSFDPEQHDAYFLALARFVSDGLAACGYPLCKGDVMATNRRWRQPLSVWQRYFRDWIEDPDPESLLNSAIFFDLGHVHGEAHRIEALQALIVELAPRNPRFLAAMARNALNRTPPIGLFRTFILEKDGQQNDAINLKRRGTAPLVDLVRVHALACGSSSSSTLRRLEDIARTQLLPEGVNDRLRYAFEYISMVRIRHQALAIEQGEEADNRLRPANVSSRERHHLKDAFEVLSHAQKFLKFRYPMPSSSGRRR
ncbi:putative nucleotidyltransferase substrate binding domain-containing protein [Kushneria aurantia]|uniref:Nucleotidyltransferase substrate binding domain-containing protein n=1 Tax=Kushneria aurantia TaxID=504092 RepID=A0ABV6G964_9GAMM|nr:putative nucleotidyltransferase substrate binding domain-containing protein [Kushneria aurantia]